MNAKTAKKLRKQAIERGVRTKNGLKHAKKMFYKLTDKGKQGLLKEEN